jgi:hypothetical protein
MHILDLSTMVLMSIVTAAEPLPSEAVILALVFEQHKLIPWLKSRYISKKYKNISRE